MNIEGATKKDNRQKLVTQGTQDDEKQNKNTKRVGHHFTQTNINNVGTTRAFLQMTNRTSLIGQSSDTCVGVSTLREFSHAKMYDHITKSLTDSTEHDWIVRLCLRCEMQIK